MNAEQDAQSLVGALLRRYLSAEGREPSADWQRVDDGAHLGGVARILETLEGPRLPSHGDPLAVVELEWRSVHAKHRAFARFDSIYLDSPDVLEEMAEVMRRWPSIRYERGAFGDLCPGQYQACLALGEQLQLQAAVALDGVRAKLRYELEMREIWEEGETAEPRGEAGSGCDLLRRAIAVLDQACPDPMLQLGYQIAELRRDTGDPQDSAALETRLRDLELRARGLHATTLEGALVHFLLALAHLDAEAGAEPCKRHIARACRVLEAHTGMIAEELGGTCPGGEVDPLLAAPAAVPRALRARSRS